MIKLDMVVNGNVFSYCGESTATSDMDAFKESRDAFLDAATADSDTEHECDCDCACEEPESSTYVVSTKKVIDGSIEKVMNGIISGEIILNIGDAIMCVLTGGQRVTFEVTDIDEESYRLEMKELLEIMAREDIKEWYVGLYKMFPKTLRDAVIPTKRKYKKDGDGELKEIDCMLFMPSASEVFSEEEFEENSWLGDKGVYKQLDFYKDWRNRIRCTVEDGKPNAWWLLSAYAGLSTGFAFVVSNGDCSTSSATYTWVAAPVCFRIRKSR